MENKRIINLSAMSRKELEEEYIKANDKAAALEAELEWMRQQVRLSKSKTFGASSEKGMLEDGVQQSLFNEAELHSDTEAAEPTAEELTKQKRQAKKKGEKKAKVKALPVVVAEYELSEEEQICPACGEPLHEMKKIIREEIEVIPAKYQIRRHVRHVYACRNCEKQDTQATILQPRVPEPMFRNSLASPSLVADIIHRKYVLSLPLYRQEQEFARYGLSISRQTISNWITSAADRYLYRIYEAMKERLREADILHADETEVQVLREPGRAAASKSYMWVYASGKYEDPCYVYEYAPGRGAVYPKKFLNGFSGYLQTDGYSVYQNVADDPERSEDEKIINVCCFAHARRKFTDALKASSVKDPPNICKGIEFCDALFKVERDSSETDPKERIIYRKEHAGPILDEYFAWLKELEQKVLPRSKLAEAVKYSLNQEIPLRRYMEDGRLEISNNRAERAVKPFVIGRKNWLFSNTPDGAESSAMIYSIVETAKACDLKPFEYLTHILKVLSQTPETDIEQLLPWSKQLPDTCRMEKEARS
ncbi:MAG: IS66 family transposase [Bacillota bacterium]|nr:IS66 family transposase [Bacillota bacterium]